MAASGVERVTLSDDNHLLSFRSGLRSFLDDNLLVDVSIECRGYSLEAHRLVLAIFSPVLREALLSPDTDDRSHRKHRQPPLNLDHVSEHGGHVQHLMEFLYRGEVTLPRDGLPDLLCAAEALAVDGLVAAIRAQLSDEDGELEAVEEESTDRASLGTRQPRQRVTRRHTMMRKLKETERGAAVEEKRSEGWKGEEEEEEEDECSQSEEEERSDCPSRDSSVEEDEPEDSGDGEEEEEEWRQETASIPAKRGRGRAARSPPAKRGVGSKRPASGSGSGRGSRRNDDGGKRSLTKEYRRIWRQSRPLQRCDYCDYETRDKSSFASHLGRHDPAAERYVCDTCGKSFRSKKGIRCHRLGHSGPERLHKCSICTFTTPQKWNITQHLAVIHKLDPEGNPLSRIISCAQCEFTCVANHQLKAHVLRKHTVDKPFKCQQCDYSTVIRHELEKHVGIRHENERRYMCESCGFRSQTQGGLTRHKRSHTGAKPFQCHLCQMCYADRGKLKIHLLRHTNDEKPFVCEVCGHSCRRRDNLRMHMRRIHGSSIELDGSSVVAAGGHHRFHSTLPFEVADVERRHLQLLQQLHREFQPMADGADNEAEERHSPQPSSQRGRMEMPPQSHSPSSEPDQVPERQNVRVEQLATSPHSVPSALRGVDESRNPGDSQRLGPVTTDGPLAS